MISETDVKDFLRYFKSEYQTHLIDFCNTLSSTHADVYFLMARKATCFFSCLEELGLIHLDGYVTSERVLDMDLQWLMGKDVIIIDDAIVSGTTINDTINKLNNAGVNSIRVFVLTVNRKWYQADMLRRPDGTSYLVDSFDSVEDVECISLCYKVVEAILCYPRPYDIDFPLYKKVTIKPQFLSKLFNHSGWSSYEVTTLDQDRSGIRSFTIIPSKDTQKRFLSQYRCSFIGESLLKIRVYINVKNKGKKSLDVRFLPVVVLDELSEVYLNDIFEDLVRNYPAFVSAFYSTKSRLRFLQFFYSHKFMEFWCKEALKESLFSVNNLEFSEKNMTFIFSDTVDTEFRDFCCSSAKQTVLFNYEKPVPELVTIKEIRTEDDNDPMAIEDFLISQFINLYYEKEIPCREIVLEYGRQVFDTAEYKQLVSRLKTGYTFRDLVQKLSDRTNEVDVTTCVSVFLDRAIDYGMVVPITQMKNGVVSRAYRHGEDIVFGEREAKLFVVMLRSFQDYSRGDAPLTHIAVEKMMVLFTKIGLHAGENGFKQYLSNFTCAPIDTRTGKKCGVLRIKPYLKGNIALVGSVEALKKQCTIPFATEDDKALWLSNIFKKKKYITLRSARDYNLYNIKKDISTSTIELPTINWSKKVGRLFGKVCNAGIDTGVTFGDEELICISTCCSIRDTILALTAEINIFIEEWRSEWENKDQSEHLISLEEKYYRSCALFEGPNSANMKVKAFDENKAWNLVDSVKFDNETEQDEWTNFFYNLRRNAPVEGEKEDVYHQYNRGKYLVMQLLYATTVFDLLLLIKDTKGKRTQRYRDLWRRIQMYHDEIMAFHKTSKPGPFLQNMYEMDNIYSKLSEGFENDETTWDISDSLESANQIIEFINEDILPDCGSYIEYIEAMLGQSGKIHDVTPNKHVVCVVYSYSSDEEMQLYRKIIQTIAAEINLVRTTELNDSDAPKPIVDSTDISFAWFVCDDDEEAGELALFSSKIMYHLFQDGCTKYRIIYFGDLPFKSSIICRKDDKTFLCCYSFYRFIETIDKRVFKVNDSNAQSITTLISSSSYEHNNYIKRFESEKSKRIFRIIKKQELDIGGFSYSESRIDVDKSALVVNNNGEIKKTMENKKFDIGILTVIPEEAQAVISEFGLHESDAAFSERVFYEGEINTRNIIMTQSVTQGNSSIATAYDALVGRYRPKFVVLVGIAGRVSDSIQPCDVVVATEVWAYDFYKETNDGRQSRNSLYRIPVVMEPVFQRLSVNYSEMESSEGSPSNKFKVEFGSIASGSGLISADESETKARLLLVTDKILALEMEGYGFCVASHENALSDNKTIASFIVRGISDKADGNKTLDSNYRKPAAKNAAKVAKQLIKLIPLEAFEEGLFI